MLTGPDEALTDDESIFYEFPVALILCGPSGTDAAESDATLDLWQEVVDPILVRHLLAARDELLTALAERGLPTVRVWWPRILDRDAT